jgi:nucleotide-binding universal stress UspA family protein
MSSPAFFATATTTITTATATAATAEELHGIRCRGLRPALDAVFPLLLAITDDERAASAIRMTRVLARTHGAIPTVLRALGSDRETDVLVQPFAGYVAEGALSPEYRDESREQLQRQVTDVAGDVRWQFEVADESPVEAIVDHARQLRAGLIVIGLRRHGVVHRVVAGDLLRSVVRLAGVPVLAVRPNLVALPRRVVVAVDFGEASIRAASMARHILAEDGEMHLVHVVTDSAHQHSSPANMTGAGPFTRALRDLESMIEDLRPGPRMTITSHVIEGERHAAIDGFAERVRADLLAVGSDEHPLFDRIVNRSVSMTLARTARRSMLVVPSRDRTHDSAATDEHSAT